MAVQEKLMTVEEFWAQYAGKPYELIEGVPVRMRGAEEGESVTPTGGTHGSVERRIGMLVGHFVDEHGLGDVFTGEVCFQLSPTVARAADAAFVSMEKLLQTEDPSKFLPYPPDLAVEVTSPNDRASENRQKIAQYLEAGTRLVWEIYPELEEVVVYKPDGTARTYRREDTLTGEDVLPGLEIPVARLFPDYS